MAVDPYGMCPCGSGKKLKFCCSDLVGEIEKIHRMIGGDQPRAALRHVEQTLGDFPDRASLLDLKAILELSLGDLDAARQTIDRFVAKHPDSPTALACQALLLAETNEARQAVAVLQHALGMLDRELPQRVYEAIGGVGRSLLVAGHVVAAQAHLWLYVHIGPKEDTKALELIVGLNHYSGLPLLLRDQLQLRPWTEGAAWRAQAEEVSILADHGKWQQAVERVDQLGGQYGADPTLVYNRALLGGFLGDERALAAGFHAYAQLDVPLDDAMEAEAIAQLLDPDGREEQIDSILQIYEVLDLDALTERLAGDRRLQSFEPDGKMWRDRGQPAPRLAYVLLDRPMPTSGAELTRDDVPRLAATMLLFGRQTDRRERLELMIDRGPRYDATIAALREIAGEALNQSPEERVIGSVSPTEQALNWRWQFPIDTPQDVRQRLLDEERRAAVVERWPEVPRPGLGGQSPREAAGDSRMRIPLMAAVLILEQGSNVSIGDEMFADLRRRLGLPQVEPLEPTGDDGGMPLIRVPRLKMEAVSDDDLVQLYRRSVLAGATAATLHTAREAVRRPSLASRIPPAEAYARMIGAEDDPERALATIDEARQHSKDAGESTAHWDVAELRLHLTNGDGEQARTALQRIERQHVDDPAIASEVYQILYEFGVIRPEEMPMDDMPEEAAMAAGPAAPGQIWTPDSDRPAGGKSSLWTPS